VVWAPLNWAVGFIGSACAMEQKMMLSGPGKIAVERRKVTACPPTRTFPRDPPEESKASLAGCGKTLLCRKGTASAVRLNRCQPRTLVRGSGF
jgi:hypothetical protein